MTVTLPFRNDAGTEIATITISNLSSRSLRLEPGKDLAVIQEEGTYLFVLDVPGVDGPVHAEPSELFSFDETGGRRGRLRPRSHVGRIPLRLRIADRDGYTTLSVQPTKLEAGTEYQQMLSDIAEIATDAMLQGFAPATMDLVPEADKPAELLYQQFAFLHARLMASGETDLALITNHPHTAWIDSDELRPAGTPLRGGSRNLRALNKPGPRSPTADHLSARSVPSRLTTTRTEETLDTEANRFVLFALERWRQLAHAVHDKLSHRPRTGPMSRGMDAAEEVLELLDRVLLAPMFRDVGTLRSFPSGNQVLEKRAGYREILRTFVLAETSARLVLELPVEDAFAASLRNLSTLYELWAFLQLSRCVDAVCGAPGQQPKFRHSKDGMSVGFQGGQKSRMSWDVEVRGRALRVELYFNRRFIVSGTPDSSWTREMRPDCSLLVRPAQLGSATAEELSIWVHFDAKYRVDYKERQFAKDGDGDEDLAADDEAEERLGRSRREDLLKMHAYRDAIRRSAGAYVLYPGNEEFSPFTQHHELLPGLGAFALRPGKGEVAGAARLETFLRDVFDHVADTASQHERSRYWQTLIHRAPPSGPRPDRRLPSLDRPPSDASVLCGYVRSEEHRQWILTTGFYNVRTGDRPGAVGADADILQATDLVLYGDALAPTLWSRDGAWFVQTREDLVGLGYPAPGGQTYLCCPIVRREDEPEWLAALDMERLERPATAPVGAPFASTWQALLDGMV